MSGVKLNSPQSMTLEGCISLENLMDYRRELDEQLPSEVNLSVDLSQLETEDSSILALLVYLVRRTGIEGGQVTFSGASDHLRDMADLSGLASLIQWDVNET